MLDYIVVLQGWLVGMQINYFKTIQSLTLWKEHVGLITKFILIALKWFLVRLIYFVITKVLCTLQLGPTGIWVQIILLYDTTIVANVVADR